jgi:hypothetical protein
MAKTVKITLMNTVLGQRGAQRLKIAPPNFVVGKTCSAGPAKFGDPFYAIAPGV